MTQKPEDKGALDQYIEISKSTLTPSRLFFGAYAQPACYKSRLLLSACEIEEMSPFLYIPYEIISPSCEEYINRENVDVIEPAKVAGNMSVWDFTMKKLLPALAKESKYKAIFFDGTCALVMDSAFLQAQEDCKRANAVVQARNSNTIAHDASYPCQQCYGRLMLKAQKFIMALRDLWRQRPESAAHILFSFREKIDTKTIGYGRDAVTETTYKPDFPANTNRTILHELQTYVRLTTSSIPRLDDKKRPIKIDNVLQRDVTLNIQALRSKEADTRDNTGGLPSNIVLTGDDIKFRSIYNRIYNPETFLLEAASEEGES